MIDYGDDDEWKLKCHDHDDDHFIISVDYTQNHNEDTVSWFLLSCGDCILHDCNRLCLVMTQTSIKLVNFFTCKYDYDYVTSTTTTLSFLRLCHSYDCDYVPSTTTTLSLLRL